MFAVKYPHVKVKMIGEDGNAWAIIGRVIEALRQAGVPKSEIDAWRDEATSGSYDDLLVLVMNTVDIDLEEESDEADVHVLPGDPFFN